MSANIIDELMIVLGLDGSKAKAGMADVTKSIESGLSGVTKMFTGFGAALAGVFSVGSAFSTWKEQAQEFGNVARNLHMGIEDVQAWSGAIGKFGGSAGDFEQSIRGLNVQLARMATLGTSKGGKLLESVGIDAGSIGRQRDALEVMEELAAAVEQMTPDESRGFLQALGLDSATIMLLQQGRDGMKDLIRQKKEDAVYTKEDYEAIRQYNVEMGKVKKGFIGIMSVAFRTIMPALTAITKGVAVFVSFLKKNQATIKIFFTMIATLVTGLLIPTFLKFAKALMTNPFTWIVLGLLALAFVLEDIWGWMNGKESEWGETWQKLFGDPETAKKKLDEYLTMFWEFTDKAAEAMRSLMKAMGENSGLTMLGAGLLIFAGLVKTVIIPAISMIVGAFRKMITFVKNVPKVFMNVVTKIKNAFGLLRTAFQLIRFVITGLFKVIARLFMANPITAAIMAVITVLMDLYEWVTTGESMFDGLWTAIFGDPEHAKEIFNDVCQFLEDVWNAAIKFVKDKWEWLKSTATSVCETIKGAIQSVADFIRSALGSAIDWAAQKWEALKSAVSGGVTFSQSDMSYLGWGGGGSTTTNNISSGTNYTFGTVNINGAQNPNKIWKNFVPQTNGG